MSIQERLRGSIKEIKQKYDSGMTLRDLGKEYECNSGTIWAILKEYNYLRPSKKLNRTKDFSDEIINRFKSGETMGEISKQVNISVDCIAKFLRKNSFDTSLHSSQRENGNKVVDYTDKILKLYNDGYNQREISELIECSQSSVHYVLKKNKVKIRGAAQYSVKETYFSKIDTQEKAYILGWMYSDGNVEETGKFRIQIQSSDDYILNWIKKEIRYTGPLYYIKPPKKFPHRKNQTCLCVNRKPMTDDLIKLGCVPKKSLILKFPTEDIVPKEFMPHFLRGFFDGDGSLYKKYVCITSTDNFINDMNEYLIKNIGIEGGKSYYRYKNKNTVSYKLRKEDSKKFLDWIYKDSKVHLNRKYSLYTELSV